MKYDKVIEFISHGIIAGLINTMLYTLLMSLLSVDNAPYVGLFEVFIIGFAVSLCLRSFSRGISKSKKVEICIKIEKNGQHFQCQASGEKEAVEIINRVLAERESDNELNEVQ